MLEELKELVWKLNLELPKQGLVRWTSGNVSGRDVETGYVATKPSGVRYEELRAEDIVIVDLDGNVIDGNKKPSVDTPTHLYVYQHMPKVNGVVHTHSNYATAFAAAGKPIPVCLTAIADEFGCEIPLGKYCRIGETQIGEEIVRSIGDSQAILMKNHGVFTVGPDPASAVKAAVMVEDAAKTMYMAMQIGSPDVIPPEEVARAHKRYMEKYGQ